MAAEAEVCLLLVLAFIFPPAAVAFVAGCGADLCLNVLLTMLGYFPGLIHAFWLTLRRAEANERYGYRNWTYYGMGDYAPRYVWPPRSGPNSASHGPAPPPPPPPPGPPSPAGQAPPPSQAPVDQKSGGHVYTPQAPVDQKRDGDAPPPPADPDQKYGGYQALPQAPADQKAVSVFPSGPADQKPASSTVPSSGT